MSVTDELRAELTKRGIEWRWEDERTTYWYVTVDGEEWGEWTAIEMGGYLHLSFSSGDVLTPAQAIAATLGRDQRNCHNISDFNPVDVFTCSECGSSFKVRQFKIDADGILDDETEFEFVPMHCPWCGAKVVDE